MSTSTVDETGIGQSEAQLAEQLARLIDAGISIVQIKTREPGRTLESLRKHITADDQNSYREFDIVMGSRLNYSPQNCDDHALKGDDKGGEYVSAMRYPLTQLNTDSGSLRGENPKLMHCVFNVPVGMTNNNPVIIEMIKLYYTVLPTTRACLIFITADEPINVQPGMIHVLTAPTPTLDELEAYLRSTVERIQSEYDEGADISDEEFESLARLGAGLTKDEFDNCVCLTIVDNPASELALLTAEPFYEGISKGKTEVVKQSDILELYHPEDMSNVAGMSALKEWVEDRKDVFSEAAREFGIKPPKALALVGVPGTGKSLGAKAIASAMGVPLLRLDFGKVFSKWVGDSESRMRQALNMVSSMGQLVLLVDEIDKGLGGMSGGGQDSGTSSRVLGSFLTWMNDNDSGVLVVVTANKIDGLPPELFRKGRMDQIFSVGLPTEAERREVLEVHLRRVGKTIEDFNDAEIAEFVDATERYVPAEIEQCVKDSLILAFNEDKDDPVLNMSHLIASAENMVPMSESHAEQIQAMEAWAATNAVPVNEPIKRGRSKPEVAAPRNTARRPTTRRRIGE